MAAVLVGDPLEGFQMAGGAGGRDPGDQLLRQCAGRLPSGGSRGPGARHGAWCAADQGHGDGGRQQQPEGPGRRAEHAQLVMSLLENRAQAASQKTPV